MGLEAGHTIDGKYRIVKLIGEGGMGAVYEGENVRIHRRVAIKVLHASVASNEEAMRRFEREAQAAGHIGNDHILEVLDLGELPDGDRYMVMEFLDGEPLAERIRRLGRLSPKELTPLIRQVLVGLKAAHERGIVHRDLKPDNIYILTGKAGTKDYVKIIDFGISKFQPLSGEMKMTRTGTVMGTPYYMSPEQASGSREADARSDLYAIGVIMYEALAGSVPFDAPTFNQLLFQIVLSEPIPIQQVVPSVDPAFATIVAKAMARDVDRRFQSSDDFIAALDQWADYGRPVTVPPMGNPDQYLPQGATAQLAGERLSSGTPAHGTPQDGNGVTRLPGGRLPLDVTAAVGSGAALGAATPNTWADSPQGLPKKSPVGLIVGAVAAVALLGAGAWFMVGNSSSEGSASSAAQAPTATPPAVTAAPTPAPTPAPAPEKPPEQPASVSSATVTTTVTTTATATSVSAPRPSTGGRPPVTPRPTPGTGGQSPPRPRPTPTPTPGGTPDFGY